MIATLCVWAFLLAIYLLFAGQASADEIVAGVLCAAAAVLWWVVIRRTSTHTFAFDLDAWAAAWRACRKLPWAVISVAGVLLGALVCRNGGEVVRRFFAHGRHADPADGGRRAIGVMAASLAPDSFVLRTPAERDEIIVHTLLACEQTKDPRWPI